MKFGFSEEEYLLLHQIVIQPLKDQGAQVWIFGSRATGKHQKFSDVDLLFSLPSDNKLSEGFLFEIKSNLEDSDFPYKCDLVRVDSLADSYKESAMRERVLL